MLTKTELNAYLATLKGVAKAGDFKTVSIKDGLIRTTNGNIFATLQLATKGDGQYELSALDALKVNTEIDLSVYRISDFDDTVERKLQDIKFDSETHVLTDQEKASLVFASSFVSTDDTRQALMQTVIKDTGWFMATDGYRAFVERAKNLVPEQTLYFPPELINAFKRTQKFGNWTLKLGHDSFADNLFYRFANESFSLVGLNIEYSYPDIIKIMQITEPMDLTVDVPVRDLAKLVDPQHRQIHIDGECQVYLSNYAGEKKLTPLKACVSHCTPFVPDQNWTRRIVIMPLKVVEGELAGVDYNFVKNMPTVDEYGEVRLVLARGKASPMIVVEE